MHKKNQPFGWFFWNSGAPGRIRTSDPQVRSLVLYPAELRAREKRNFVTTDTCSSSPLLDFLQITITTNKGESHNRNENEVAE